MSTDGLVMSGFITRTPSCAGGTEDSFTFGCLGLAAAGGSGVGGGGFSQPVAARFCCAPIFRGRYAAVFNCHCFRALASWVHAPPTPKTARVSAPRPCAQP